MEVYSNILPIGSQLRGGDYTIERHLGSGGFGNTYLVLNRLNKRLAVKEFFLKDVCVRNGREITISTPSGKANFEIYRKKFQKEALRVSKISNPHVVKVHDLFDENGTTYYTMDYIEGQSLKERMVKQGHPFSETEVLQILPQLLDALECIHGQHPKLLHLDLKPANIMQDQQGNVYLIDFGASKQVSKDDATSTSTGLTFTQGYAPIEQINDIREHIGPWTDYYALGATLYNILTNRSPKLIDNASCEDGFGFTENVSPKMQNLIVKLMRHNYKDRPQSVDVIRQLVRNTQESVRSNPSTVPTWFNRYSLFFEILLSIIVFVGIGIGIYKLFLMREKPKPSPITSKVFGFKMYKVNGVSFKMIRVKGGSFTMGALDETSGITSKNERPAHEVILSPYYISETEVTQELWEAVMGKSTTEGKWSAEYGLGDNFPVYNVSYDDCLQFIKKLNEQTGLQFRLPTEAEWEYAARGGSKTHGYWYGGSNDIDFVAWYKSNSDKKIHEVKTKKPNELNIYDMTGNVWEWCRDGWYQYESGTQVNPVHDSFDGKRICRGSGANTSQEDCRITLRSYVPSTYVSYELGFRLALSSNPFVVNGIVY